MKTDTFKAALFDLDGVVLDSEPQYSLFWGAMGKLYQPEVKDFAQRIKGQTLEQIYAGWFGDDAARQAEITKKLDAFELQMKFEYIPGFERFIQSLKAEGVLTAIVTSSNDLKMSSVFAARPELKGYFDRILTSKDYNASKPAPDCYLKAAKLFGVQPTECVVFEDSINGLKAGRASQAFVVGLATTNPSTTVAPLSDLVVPDFTSLTFQALQRAFRA